MLKLAPYLFLPTLCPRWIIKQQQKPYSTTTKKTLCASTWLVLLTCWCSAAEHRTKVSPFNCFRKTLACVSVAKELETENTKVTKIRLLLREWASIFHFSLSFWWADSIKKIGWAYFTSSAKYLMQFFTISCIYAMNNWIYSIIWPN